ncbi:MAG: hypothetical protein AB1Z98_34855, partial [Nannocystaceae bacterium]
MWSIVRSPRMRHPGCLATDPMRFEGRSMASGDPAEIEVTAPSGVGEVRDSDAVDDDDLPGPGTKIGRYT